MKKILSLLLILAGMAAALTGCGVSASVAAPAAETQSGEKLEKFSGYVFEAFDTVITVTAYCPSQEEFDRLLETAESEFLRYHRLYDIYFTYPDTVNLRSVNDRAGETVPVPPEIFDILSFSKEMYTLTGGKMNVAMGSVLKIWHDVREYNNVMPNDKRLPDRAELEAAAEHGDIDALELDAAAGTVTLTDPLMRLDVGAVAKGYATERVAETLAELGYEHFVINAGGNVRCWGTKPDGKSWNIAVTDPQLAAVGGSIGTMELNSGSAVTSGSYQRFFEYEGQRYHHIIDGETLLPENRYLSVTVCTEHSDLADALSTALFNMELAEGQEFVESMDGVEAMWVLADGTEAFSAGFVLNK